MHSLGQCTGVRWHFLLVNFILFYDTRVNSKDIMILRPLFWHCVVPFQGPALDNSWNTLNNQFILNILVEFLGFVVDLLLYYFIESKCSYYLEFKGYFFFIELILQEDRKIYLLFKLWITKGKSSIHILVIRYCTKLFIFILNLLIHSLTFQVLFNKIGKLNIKIYNWTNWLYGN